MISVIAKLNIYLEAKLFVLWRACLSRRRNTFEQTKYCYNQIRLCPSTGCVIVFFTVQCPPTQLYLLQATKQSQIIWCHWITNKWKTSLKKYDSLCWLSYRCPRGWRSMESISIGCFLRRGPRLASCSVSTPRGFSSLRSSMEIGLRCLGSPGGRQRKFPLQCVFSLYWQKQFHSRMNKI